MLWVTVRKPLPTGRQAYGYERVTFVVVESCIDTSGVAQRYS